MIEPTKKVRLSRCNFGKSGKFEVPQIKEEQSVGMGQVDHGLDIRVVRHVARHEGEMRKGLTQILPDELELCPRFAGAAPRTRKLFLETFGQSKAGTIRDIDPPKGSKQAIVTDSVTRMELGKRRLGR
jgi:hypothetical protein